MAPSRALMFHKQISKDWNLKPSQLTLFPSWISAKQLSLITSSRNTKKKLRWTLIHLLSEARPSLTSSERYLTLTWKRSVTTEALSSNMCINNKVPEGLPEVNTISIIQIRTLFQWIIKIILAASKKGLLNRHKNVIWGLIALQHCSPTWKRDQNLAEVSTFLKKEGKMYNKKRWNYDHYLNLR